MIGDRAFTNAKRVGGVDGQVAVLIYRALERKLRDQGLLFHFFHSSEPLGLYLWPESSAKHIHRHGKMFPKGWDHPNCQRAEFW